MKRTLLLVLATALTAAPALAAIEMNAEAFVTHKSTLAGFSETGAKTAGTDLERFRIFVSNKFNDQWSFKGRFEFRSGTGLAYIPEAHFVGTGILMANDTMKFGIQDNPVFTMESALGTRWISKSVIDAEGFVATAGTQSGGSYRMAFNALGLTLFALSAEDGAAVDSDDNQKLNGAMVEYKFNDAVTAWIQSANTNQGVVANSVAGVVGAVPTAKGTAITSVGVNYKSEMVDAGFNYHAAAYTVETGTAPKSNTVMALTGVFKKVGGSSTNIYAHYWAGYDAYDATAGNFEDTQSKMMIGPTWTLAEGKINLGAFYEMETLQGDFKTANPTVKEPSAAYVKLAAKF